MSARHLRAEMLDEGHPPQELLRERPRVFDDDQVLELARAADARLRQTYAWEG